MGAIKGISVELETAALPWSDSTDKLFLGVFGTGGGREFRLADGGSALTSPNAEYLLALGDPCCATGDEVQALYSTGLGDNDPLYNKLDINEVAFVYLRKETDDSTAQNDDVLSLDFGQVTLCDVDGNLERFSSKGRLNFSDETGLQHWLLRTQPPQIWVTVTLTEIAHVDQAKHPAGFNWYFDFGATVAGQTVNLLDDHHIKIKKKHEPDEWHRHFKVSHTFKLDGCCGSEVPVRVDGRAEEHDWPSADDIGSGSQQFSVGSGPDTPAEAGSLSLAVNGNSDKRKSQITYKYEIETVCL